MAKQTFTLEQVHEAEELMQGLCIECGATRDGCEPDARRLLCPECNTRNVYGTDEILAQGLVR